MSLIEVAARKYLGLAPYDGPGNLAHDVIFANHCKRVYGTVAWDRQIAELRGKK